MSKGQRANRRAHKAKNKFGKKGNAHKKVNREKLDEAQQIRKCEDEDYFGFTAGVGFDESER